MTTDTTDTTDTAGGQARVVELLRLDDPRATEVAVAGRKAAALAELQAAGHRVPQGVVLPTDACERLAEQGDATFARGALARALDDLGGGPVAVRSSGVAEDLGGASYAGQYDTVLDVTDVDGLCDAVATCIASVDSARTRAYGGTPAPMAVLVQRQVAADAAGVAFSANPVTGDRDETLVSAVRGLGERLVSGEASPDEWVVRDGSIEQVAGPEDAITADQAGEVATLADRLEGERGAPQDVEWAIAEGELFLLQSRPITALPVPPSLDVPNDGTWIKDVAHYPELMTPFGASTFLPVLDAGITQAAADYGLLIETMTNVSLGGEVYGQPTPVGGKSGPPPPAIVIGLLSRVVPAMRRRMKAAERAVRSGMLEEAPRRWEAEWRDQFRREADRVRKIDLATLDDEELQAHLDELLELMHRGQIIHFRLFLPHAVAVHELVTTCEQLLDFSALDALELVVGLSEVSSEPARRLAALAARVRAHPVTQDFDGTPSELVGRLRRDASDLADAFDDHVARYGHRTPNYDPGAPTMAERPQLAAALLLDAVAAEDRDLSQELATRREDARERARAALRDHAPADRERFERVLERAEAVYGLREDNVFWTDNVPSGLLRRAAVEVGHRLAARGQLRRPGDVAYLEIDEVRAGLADRERDLSDEATRRRAEQAWVAAHPGPPFHGDEPAPSPDTRHLPAPGRRINAAMMWFMDQEFTPTATEQDGGLAGTPGSPGQYTGPVRVIRGEADFHRLRPGDVLVAPVTTPVWSVLFGMAGAVVTDGGGTLSHAAIVAREHGIPAVLNTGDGTSQLTDGQVVTVDGAAGVVRPA